MSTFTFNMISFFFCFSVEAGPPDPDDMHSTWLPLRLEQISSCLYLQVVHSSGLHAVSDCAFCGAGAQGAAPPPLRGPNPDPHSTGLGEEPAKGRDQ